jgi:phosphoserine phosphatase
MSDEARKLRDAAWMPGGVDPWRLRHEVTVLIVDPDPATRAEWRRVLADGGYDVQETEGGPDALDLITETLPYAIIVNNATGSGGLSTEWIRRLKENPVTCGIPVIGVVDARSEEPLPSEAVSHFDELVTWPIRDSELVLRVQSMVRLRQHRLELAEGRSLHGEQTRWWDALLEFSRGVVKLTSLDAMFDDIVLTAAEMPASRRVSLMLPDEDAKHLTIAKSIGLDEQMARNVRVPIGEAIAGRAYRSGQPVTTLDGHTDLARRKGFNFRSFVSMPMTYTTMSMVHQRVGVLNISDRYGDRPFEEWELEFIDLLGSIAGSAIDDIHARETRESLLRIERDLQVARRIQRKTFPAKLPAMHGFEIDAWSEPAEETAGDTYDVIGFKGNGDIQSAVLAADVADRAIMLLADATGHGIGPALSVTQVRAMLRMALRMQPELLRIAHHMNEQLCADLPGGRFVTAWLGELDVAKGTLFSLSAGQAPILHFRADRGVCDVLPADTMPLGIVDGLEITAAEPIQLDPGDIVAVISDGVIEATDAAGEQFGTERTVEVISAHCGQRPIRIRTALRRAVAKFTGGGPAADDRTAIILKCLEC